MYDTEEEQIEALKKWWQENGNYLIGAFILGVAGYFGATFYNQSALEKKESASAAYQELVTVVTESAENEDAVSQLVGELKQQHGDSTYAVYGALYAAKLAVEDGQLDNAAAELNWALDQNVSKSLMEVIQLRLARIEFARGNTEAALKLLDSPDVQQVVGFEEVRGDILLSQGNLEAARNAYSKALEAARAGNMQRPLLEMKLNDLTEG